MNTSEKLWTNLHKESRYRPKYPSEAVVQFVFRNFARDGKTKVLDLGCGAGRHVFFMGREDIVPYGVDFSTEGIEYTKNMLKEYGMEKFSDNMKVADLCELPFENHEFDGVICYGVLYYLGTEDIAKAVKEIYRVLKPSGKVMCVVRNTNDYRCNNLNCDETDEKNTYIINEQDSSKCASSENGMLMHFFERDEISKIFSEFSEVKIDRIMETHNDGEFCDDNFIICATK